MSKLKTKQELSFLMFKLDITKLNKKQLDTVYFEFKKQKINKPAVSERQRKLIQGNKEYQKNLRNNDNALEDEKYNK